MRARFGPNASMSRNCSVSVPGGPTDCQVAPRSVVRRTVPALPLAQATFALTAESPRRLAVEPVGVSCQENVCDDDWPAFGFLGLGGGFAPKAIPATASAPTSEATS